MQMVSMGARWHEHGTGADLGWPVEVDARMCLGWWWCIEKGQGALKHVGTHQRGPRHVCEVMAGAGTHEGCAGHIWDGGGTLRRGRACQRGWACQRGRGMSKMPVNMQTRHNHHGYIKQGVQCMHSCTCMVCAHTWISYIHGLTHPKLHTGVPCSLKIFYLVLLKKSYNLDNNTIT